ncbi:ArsR family transcriptional regulator [Paenibacillus sp. CAA11]|uniref:MarR family transcriptional regulator n=1 Tax=Paenibacillus sp. CAA11 TaxID=1532905 RepID=UPI000D37D4FB|nr:MarR family transcriptional regulator [Paenibacillus sp. CAA11]AWB43012.1 ArsR family transcriptional regulator [Paenibacillus sp. CAA11]
MKSKNHHEEVFQAIQAFVLKREKKIQAQNTLEQRLAKDIKDTVRAWSVTQLHILSLVNQKPRELNNTMLAAELNVSKPAVTKAVNLLTQHGLITAIRTAASHKEVYYDITSQGKELAGKHDRLHQQVRARYDELLDGFSDEELAVILRFLGEWSKLI